MKIKGLFTVGLIAVASGYGAYIYVKKQEIDEVLDKLKIYFKDIDNFRISGGKLKLNLYLKVHNPTKTDIDVDAGVVKADVLRVFEKETGKLLAFSKINVNRVVIPAGKMYDLPTLNIEIPLMQGAVLALQQVADNKTDFMERLRIELDLKAFGYTKTITL